MDLIHHFPEVINASFLLLFFPTKFGLTKAKQEGRCEVWTAQMSINLAGCNVEALSAARDKQNHKQNTLTSKSSALAKYLWKVLLARYELFGRDDQLCYFCKF